MYCFFLILAQNLNSNPININNTLEDKIDQIDNIYNIDEDDLKNIKQELNDDNPTNNNKNKNNKVTFSQICQFNFKKIKSESKQIKSNKTVWDNLSSGIFFAIGKNCNKKINDAKDDDKKTFVILGEWFFQYSEALNISLGVNNKQLKALNMKLISGGFRFLFLLFGYGDGFFKSYLNNKILKSTWDAMQYKTIMFNDVNEVPQFIEPSLNIGLFFSFFEKIYLSLAFSNNFKEKGIAAFLHMNFHFYKIFAYLIISKNILLSIDSFIFDKSIFIHCSNKEKNKDNERKFLILFLFFINGINLIYFIIKNNITKILNNFIEISIGYKTEGEESNFFLSLIIKIAQFQIIIIYYEGEFHIIITGKYTQKSSLISQLNKKSKLDSSF